MPKPPRLVKRADGTVLTLGQGSDYIAVQQIIVTPLVQGTSSVTPMIVAQKISVAS
jgi:hypothetical protein